MLTKDEEIFVRRMAPHVEAGLSFVDAAKAVIEDDRRLFASLVSDKAVAMVEGASGDGSKMFAYGPTDESIGLRQALTSAVYQELRK